MSHLAPPTVASSRRRRLRQTGASALLAMGLVVTVFSAPSLAEDAVQGEGERAAAPSLSIAQCRDRATDAKPVADGCVDYREVLLREAAQRTQEAQRAAEVQAAAEREAEAKRKAEAEEQAKREAEAARAAGEVPVNPLDDLTDVIPTDILPSVPATTTPATTPPASTPPVSTPPVSTPPVSTPPVSTPPVPTPPVPSVPGDSETTDPVSPPDNDNDNDSGLGSDLGTPEGVIPGLQAAPAEVGSCGSSIVCSSTPTPTTTATGLPDTGAPASGGLVGLGLAMVLGGLVLLRPRRGNGRHVMAL